MIYWKFYEGAEVIVQNYLLQKICWIFDKRERRSLLSEAICFEIFSRLERYFLNILRKWIVSSIIVFKWFDILYIFKKKKDTWSNSTSHTRRLFISERFEKKIRKTSPLIRNDECCMFFRHQLLVKCETHALILSIKYEALDVMGGSDWILNGCLDVSNPNLTAQVDECCL